MTQTREMLPFGNPPIELVQDSKMLWIYAAINLIVAAGLTIWIMGRQKGPGEKQLGVMVLLGGVISTLVCPLWDHLSLVWHAPGDTVIASFMGGHVLTAWNAFAYYYFIGVLGLYVYQRIKVGATIQDLWKFWGIVAVGDIVLEVPAQLINRHIYSYYGAQPFYSYDWFPLPMTCVFGNATVPLCSAAAIILLKATNVRCYLYFLPFFVASSWFALAYALPQWMWWTGLGSNIGIGVMTTVGVVSLILTAFTHHVLAVASIRVVKAGLTN